MTMEPYANRGGDSSIQAYELGAGYIQVRFSDGMCYTYTNSTAGAENINHMHQLARQGQGLNSFIMRNVKQGYSAKGPC